VTTAKVKKIDKEVPRSIGDQFDRKGFAFMSGGVALLVILFFFVRLYPYMERTSGGFLAYFASGRVVLSGKDLSLLYNQNVFIRFTEAQAGIDSQDLYIANTPFLPYVFAPFALLDVHRGKLLWEIFSLICLSGAIYLLKKRFDLSSSAFFSILALCFGAYPVYANFVWGQFYAPLFLLHVILFDAWMDDKPITAGLVIALLLLFKGYGVMFILLALFDRKWRIAAGAVGWYVITAIATLPFIGLTAWKAYGGSILAMVGMMPRSATFTQNISSFVSWFFVRDIWHSNAPFMLPELVHPLVAILSLMCVGVVWRIMRGESARRRELGFASAIVAGVLTAPAVGDYHYFLVVLSMLVAISLLLKGRSRGQSILFASSLFLLVTKLPYDAEFFQYSLWGVFAWPRVYGGVLLLILLYQLSRLSPSDNSKALI
jgi:hypothetical protein